MTTLDDDDDSNKRMVLWGLTINKTDVSVSATGNTHEIEQAVSHDYKIQQFSIK